MSYTFLIGPNKNRSICWGLGVVYGLSLVAGGVLVMPEGIEPCGVLCCTYSERKGTELRVMCFVCVCLLVCLRRVSKPVPLSLSVFKCVCISVFVCLFLPLFFCMWVSMLLVGLKLCMWICVSAHGIYVCF